VFFAATSKGPDIHGCAVLRISCVQGKRFWLIPKIKPVLALLAVSLMRALPADGKVEPIHTLLLDTVIARVSKLERGKRKKSLALSKEATPSLVF